MKKPGYLNMLTACMAALNPTGYLFISGDKATFVFEMILFTLIILFGYWVLYKFQKGANWARILVMITSGIAILNLILIKYDSFIILLVLAAEAFLGAFLLYYLNLRYVKDYFNEHKNATV